MKLLKSLYLFLLCIIVFLALPFVHNQAFAASSWTVVDSPNPNPTGENIINDSLSAVSANDIWALGYYLDSSNNSNPLIEHYDGTSWSIAHSPIASDPAYYLTSLSAVSSTDVWAVGYIIDTPIR